MLIADTVSITVYTSAEMHATAGSGYYLEGADHLLRVALPAASIIQPHLVTAYFNLTSPPPYEARINGGGRPYLDRGGAMWVEDRAYRAGPFGINGGSSNMIANAIAGSDDDVL